MTHQAVAEVTGTDIWHWTEKRAKATDKVKVTVTERTDLAAGYAEVVFAFERLSSELALVLEPSQVFVAIDGLNESIEAASGGHSGKEVSHQVPAQTRDGGPKWLVLHTHLKDHPGVGLGVRYVNVDCDDEGVALDPKDAEAIRDALMKITGK